MRLFYDLGRHDAGPDDRPCRYGLSRWGLLVLAWLNLCILLASSAIAQTNAKEQEEIRPADVYREVQQVSHSLERLRGHMGALRTSRLNIGLRNAASHDVYFQALTLFSKTNRLSFEITRIRDQAPPLPRIIISPSEVLELVKGAHTAIQRVMRELQINPEPLSLETAPGNTPTDVIAAIQDANRQINLLLERRFSTSEVYEKVTLAVGYAARQLATYANEAPITAEPDFESHKQPSDVYFRLLNCMAIISRIYKQAELEILEIDSAQIETDHITPSDVFDLALVIVARLDFLHKHFGLQRMPRASFYPGRRYPSDVYQRTGLLEAQLNQLITLMQSKGLPSKQPTVRKIP